MKKEKLKYFTLAIVLFFAGFCMFAAFTFSVGGWSGILAAIFIFGAVACLVKAFSVGAAPMSPPPKPGDPKPKR